MPKIQNSDFPARLAVRLVRKEYAGVGCARCGNEFVTKAEFLLK
jgi:hypothetical protein